MSVEAHDIYKRFGLIDVLDGINLSVTEGEFVALLGPSGSGKTTLLRALSGLESIDAGTIRIAGQNMEHVPARLRHIGFVFQHYALFRHMTVFENIAFGLRVRPRANRPSRSEISDRVNDLLNLVQIPELADRYPDRISGGQRQRVALARALAIQPPVLLLDEPFSALDAQVREDLRDWLRGLHERLNLTSIFVTHDQAEASHLADRIAVMRNGQIEQIGTPEELQSNPATEFVANFIRSQS